MSSFLSAFPGRGPSLSLASAALLFALLPLPGAAEPAASAAANAAVAAPARFEAALPGFKVARILWREGKLVLEHGGELVVLRQGDRLPGQPLIRMIEIGERGVVLREAGVASAAASGETPLLPERLIRLEPVASPTGLSGESYSVTVLTATEPPAPAPLQEAPLAVQQVTPDGGVRTDAATHQAPLVPATQTGGGGGR